MVQETLVSGGRMLPSPSVSISVSPEADMLKGAETPDFAEVEAAMEAYSVQH